MKITPIRSYKTQKSEAVSGKDLLKDGVTSFRLIKRVNVGFNKTPAVALELNIDFAIETSFIYVFDADTTILLTKVEY